MSKVPIPAIRKEARPSRTRTSRACDACRARKIKCNGELPTCRQCQQESVDCHYSDNKRARDKKELRSARQTVDEYEELLRDLSLVVNEEHSSRIQDVLENSPRSAVALEMEDNDRGDSPLNIHWRDVIPMNDEDLNRSEESRATGYHGGASEVSWMKQLSSYLRDRVNELSYLHDTDNGSIFADGSTSGTNYHLDLQGEQIPAKKSSAAEPISRTVAADLVALYFDYVNSSLPIVREDLFKHQCSTMFEKGAQKLGAKWNAVFHLVLAIGARFYRLAHASSVADDLMLSIEAETQIAIDFIAKDDEDLQHVQIQTLTAFYFLVTSQVNRAWKFIGMAARSGIALGLNLHSTHKIFDDDSFDARVNLWWSIFQLETLLSLMTGRPSSLGENSSVAPAPCAFQYLSRGPPEPGLQSKEKFTIRWTIYQSKEEIQSQQSWLQTLAPCSTLFRFYFVDLALITHAIANRVYCVDLFLDGWSHIERRITFLNAKLGEWQSGLHPSVQFANEEGDPFPGILSQPQTVLAFHFYSACIVLNRPCFMVSEVDKKTEIHFPHSDPGSLRTPTCLSASMRVVSLLPSQPDMEWVLRVAPWWCLLHFIVQATTILLIHISTTLVKASASGASFSVILDSTKNAIRWLFVFGSYSEAASRAFHRCYSCLQLIAVAKAVDISDLAGDLEIMKLQASDSLLGVQLATASERTDAASPYSYSGPFGSLGSSFDIQGRSSDSSRANFGDMLMSLIDQGSQSDSQSTPFTKPRRPS